MYMPKLFQTCEQKLSSREQIISHALYNIQLPVISRESKHKLTFLMALLGGVHGSGWLS